MFRGDVERVQLATSIQVDASRAAYAAIIPQKLFDGFNVETRNFVWRELITAKCESEQIIMGEEHAQICAYADYGRSRDRSDGQTTAALVASVGEAARALFFCDLTC